MKRLVLSWLRADEFVNKVHNEQDQDRELSMTAKLR